MPPPHPDMTLAFFFVGQSGGRLGDIAGSRHYAIAVIIQTNSHISPDKPPIRGLFHHTFFFCLDDGDEETSEIYPASTCRSSDFKLNLLV